MGGNPAWSPERHVVSVNRRSWPGFTRARGFVGHLPYLPVFGRIKPVLQRNWPYDPWPYDQVSAPGDHIPFRAFS